MCTNCSRGARRFTKKSATCSAGFPNVRFAARNLVNRSRSVAREVSPQSPLDSSSSANQWSMAHRPPNAFGSEKGFNFFSALFCLFRCCVLSVFAQEQVGQCGFLG
eukprot:8214066-Pyramimonas_sp.AAC.1